MKNWTVENLQTLILSQHQSTSSEAIEALNAFADLLERIKAGESAVLTYKPHDGPCNGPGACKECSQAIGCCFRGDNATPECMLTCPCPDPRDPANKLRMHPPLPNRPRPPTQPSTSQAEVRVDRSVAIRLAQYGSEYAYLHKDWSIESLQDGCEEHIESWIDQAIATPSKPELQGGADEMPSDAECWKDTCTLMLGNSEPAQAAQVPLLLDNTAHSLHSHLWALDRKWDGLRAAASHLGIDPGYLCKLRSGNATNPSDEILAKLGLVRCVSYMADPTPAKE